MSPSESNSTTRAVGLRQRQAKREAGMSAHRRIAERHVERLARGELHPMPPAAPGHDDRVAAVFGEDLQQFGDVHHDRAPLTG